jgi:hypothetical protein
MNTSQTLQQLLVGEFAERHINAAVEHFGRASEAFQRSSWEGAIAKTGKFIEAVLKALYVRIGQAVPRSRAFKVDQIVRALEQTPQGTYDDSIRLTIPRACRFAYDVASNRGARHDPDEVDPNQMDATILLRLCGWILAEMVRSSQKGALHPDPANEMVARLMAPRYPLIENIDGRDYFHGARKNARSVALVLLNFQYPSRMNRQDIVRAIQRHGFSENAARVAMTRLKAVVDDDGQGNLCILAPGRREAEDVMATSSLLPETALSQ